VGDVAQVFEAARADHDQRDHQEHEPARPVVAPQPVAAERLTNAAMQPEQMEVPAQQFQAAIRGQLLRHERDGQIGLDDPSQLRYRQPHQKGLLCVRVNVPASSLMSASEALLIHPTHSFRPESFSDQG